MSEGNYAKLVAEWRARFLTTDIPARAAALEIPLEADQLTITYLNRSYSVSCTDGSIRPLTYPDSPVPHYDAMFLYHLFWFSAPRPVPSGELVPFRDVKGAAVFDPAFRTLAIDRLSQNFSGRAERLKAACQALGARMLPYGDVSCALPVFGGLEVAVIFWDGDAEFPAAANMLFDRNITDFTHVETVVTVGVDAVNALLMAAGIPDAPHQQSDLPGGDCAVARLANCTEF